MHDTHDCSACPLADRRRFITDVARLAAGALISAGLYPRPANALPINIAEALLRDGNIVRYPIPPADGATIDRSAQVILVRYHQSVFAFRRTCPHQNTALRWREGDGRFQCPKHNSRYTPKGNFISGRATRGMDRFPVTRDGENIAVDTSRFFKQDEDAEGWESARVDL